MGCGTSVAALPVDAVTYDDNLPFRESKLVKSSDSVDSGVGYELGSKESTLVADLPDVRHLHGHTFADRRPLPPHPFEATFTERFPLIPVHNGPREFNNDIENLAKPRDDAAEGWGSEEEFSEEEMLAFISEESEHAQVQWIEGLPRPPTPEFLVSGQPLRPLRGAPPKQASMKRGEIRGAVAQARHHEGLGEHMLNQLKDFDSDMATTKRPPSRGGLAFDVVFGEEQELHERVERLKKRQKSKPPKLQRKISKAQVQKKLMEAEIRRQKQQLDTLTKLTETHSGVEEAGQRVSTMESMKRAEMKRAQDAAMEKAVEARRKHLEEMRDRIKAKNEKIKRANENKMAGRPPTRGESIEKLPSILGF